MTFTKIQVSSNRETRVDSHFRRSEGWNDVFLGNACPGQFDRNTLLGTITPG